MSSPRHELKQTKMRGLETYGKRSKNLPQETDAKVALYTQPGPVFFVRMSWALYSVHRIKGIDVSRLNPTAADV